MIWMKTLAASAVSLALCGAAQAALIPLGNGTVLDDATNLIWLEDWNLNGQKSRKDQMDWADALDFAGSQDWALPTRDQYLTLFSAWPTQSAFTKVQSGYYWSRTPVGFQDDYFAVDTVDLGPNNYPSSRLWSAVAVRAATAAVPVPEPQALALTAVALAALGLVRRRALTAS
jgi:hypothetical protein